MDPVSLGLQLLCIFFVSWAMWWIGSKKRAGFLIGLLAQFFWLALFIYLKTYIVIITCAVYGTLYFRGWIKWKEEKCQKQEVQCRMK